MMPTRVQLMASSSATNVENTILLLMRCKQFQIDGSKACLRKMLPLVFSLDKSIYEAVENAFITIYIRKNPVETAKSLLYLAIDSNIGDLAALEFIVSALVSKGDITASMDNGINAELGLATSEDAILDILSERAEKEIVSGGSTEKNLIGHCAPFLSKLCRNFGLMQKYPELQASGMLALCRFMIIDADFCVANLQLLFIVVESAPSETVRSNCTIALGDLTVRFPNLLEPWTENVYARLRDALVSVRKNAVLVLSHLILNHMMKVKGYINEMAMCLEDEDERISNLVKLFFHELSKKGNNPIYNLLKDILGKLSNENLRRESFCNIMQFLIGSIKKDKQMEALVEKLCNRFSGVTDTRQWEYISYCLSQLAFSERGMKKLMQSFKTYEYVLSEDSVMDNFRNIVNKMKKSLIHLWKGRPSPYIMYPSPKLS